MNTPIEPIDKSSQDNPQQSRPEAPRERKIEDNQPRKQKHLNQPRINPKPRDTNIVHNKNPEQSKDNLRQADMPAAGNQKTRNPNAEPSNFKQTGPRNNPSSQPVKQYNQANDILLSVVIPLLNEEESIPELALQLEKELQELTRGKYEVIFIDDGSTDNSYSYIKQLNQRNKRFKCIRFRQNFGKSAALSVGFARAKGKYVATMDADLQDDPAELKNLLAKMKEGYDLVTGWKKDRKDPVSKTLPSKFFNYVTSKTSGIKLHDFNCGLKMYRKEVTDHLEVYGEMHRYLPALAYRDGFKVAEIPVMHHARRYGKSKFGMSRFLKGFLDLLTVVFVTRFMKRPLHFFGLFGTLFSILGLGINVYLTIEWILGNTYFSNRPLSQLGIALIIVGVQLFSVGLIGEMLVKNNYDKTKNYSIKDWL